MKSDFKEDLLENTLTINERAELGTLEGIISREMKSFMDVGNALLTIRDRQLYREQFRNFKAYCTERWGMSKNYANRLISGCQVAVNLGGQVIQRSKDGAHGHQLCSPCEIQPTSERQIRPLSQLEPAQQRTVWEEAVKTAPAGMAVTYTQVKALVAELIGPAPPAPPKKKDPYAHSDAHAFASMAILQLERIRDDDPLRVEGVGRVSEWIQEKLIVWTKN